MGFSRHGATRLVRSLVKEGAIKPDTMTFQEAADYLGLSRQRVYQLVSTGKLKALRIGGKQCLERAEVEQRKAAGTVGDFHAPSTEHLTRDEVAFTLGVSIATVNTWIYDDKIESVLQGHRRLVPKAEVERLLSERMGAAAS